MDGRFEKKKTLELTLFTFFKNGNWLPVHWGHGFKLFLSLSCNLYTKLWAACMAKVLIRLASLLGFLFKYCSFLGLQLPLQPWHMIYLSAPLPSVFDLDLDFWLRIVMNCVDFLLQNGKTFVVQQFDCGSLIDLRLFLWRYKHLLCWILFLYRIFLVE